MNENKKVEYRKFLDTQSNFKKIMNIKDEGILNKINFISLYVVLNMKQM